MKKRPLFILILSVLFWPACNTANERPDSTGYLVFGEFYGMCAGDCVRIYKLEGNKLFENKLKIYPRLNDYYPGIYSVLPDEQFKTVKGLVAGFPAALLNENSTLPGAPAPLTAAGFISNITLTGSDGSGSSIK